MQKVCGYLSVTVDCTNEENTSSLTPSNSGQDDGFIELNLPEGTEIVDPNGNVLYTQDGGPDKCKIKIPGA